MENRARLDSNFDALLNYDIRCMIYEYLELHPWSGTTRGFALSCTSAYEEMRTAAFIAARKVCSRYRSRVSLEDLALDHHTAPNGGWHVLPAEACLDRSADCTRSDDEIRHASTPSD